jgi:hypothetical protein
MVVTVDLSALVSVSRQSRFISFVSYSHVMWTRALKVRCALSIIAAAMLLTVNLFAQTTDRMTGQLIRRIDHIILASDDAERLYRIFTEQLRIPVAWPFRSNGTFSSGGVNLEDVGLARFHRGVAQERTFATKSGYFIARTPGQEERRD